jgi:hypothetical protein
VARRVIHVYEETLRKRASLWSTGRRKVV